MCPLFRKQFLSEVKIHFKYNRIIRTGFILAKKESIILESFAKKVDYAANYRAQSYSFLCNAVAENGALCGIYSSLLLFFGQSIKT